MARLLIIYHSRTGGTAQMAEAARVAATGETEVVFKSSRRLKTSRLYLDR